MMETISDIFMFLLYATGILFLASIMVSIINQTIESAERHRVKMETVKCLDELKKTIDEVKEKTNQNK